MPNLVDQLATFRVGYCFQSVDDGAGYYEHLAAAWRAVSAAVPWKALEPGEWALVPIFSRSLVDRTLTLSPFRHPFVEVVTFGLPSHRVAARVEAKLAEIARPGTLGVWADPPRPDEPSLPFSVDGFISFDAVILMSRDGPLARRGFDPDVGLQVVTAANEDDEILLNMATADVTTLLPHLIKLYGRNLRTWINEPRRNAEPSALVQHARELLWADAPLLAALVTGTAVECTLRRWHAATRGPGLKQRITAGGWPNRLDERARERVRDASVAKKPPLADLIDLAEVATHITAAESTRLHDIRMARNRCAHAVECDDSEDTSAVEGNIVWSADFVRRR